jgi:hypothetical protein
MDSHLLGFIDFVIRIRVQGAFYKVRVVEEGSVPREVEGTFLEDQMAWSVAASSCNSGGGEPALAVVEGLDSDTLTVMPLKCVSRSVIRGFRILQGQRVE